MNEDKIYAIQIVNRAKVAFLLYNNVFYDDIIKITRNGKEQYSFNFTATDTLHELLKEFDEEFQTLNLKKYNASFKNIAFAIRKKKDEEYYKNEISQ